MGADFGHRQEEGFEDIPLTPGVEVDPLLDLFTDLAICYEAVSRHEGVFCIGCICPLGFHILCDDGSCEFCGCDDIRKLCSTCGQSRSLGSYLAGATTCQFCINIPPVRIRPAKPGSGRVVMRSGTAYTQESRERDRANAARQVLKELTE